MNDVERIRVLYLERDNYLKRDQESVVFQDLVWENLNITSIIHKKRITEGKVRD